MILIELGYRSYIMPNDRALALIEMLESAEIYERVFIPKEKRIAGGGDYTHHVYQNEDGFSMRTISDGLYRMAKLAGKPAKEQ